MLLEGLAHPRLQSWCFLGCVQLSLLWTQAGFPIWLHVRVAKAPGCEQKQTLPRWIRCTASVAQEQCKDFWKAFVMLLHPHGNMAGADSPSLQSIMCSRLLISVRAFVTSLRDSAALRLVMRGTGNRKTIHLKNRSQLIFVLGLISHNIHYRKYWS